MAREHARRCQKCGYQWWSVSAKKPPKLRWYEDTGAITSPTARNVRLAHRKSEQLREWERFAICQRCGSQDIKSVHPRHFVPTALADSGRPIATFDRPTSPEAGRPKEKTSTFNDGERVVIKQFGFRGKTGKVDGRSMGGYRIRLDDGSTARGISGDKLERCP